MLPNAKLILSSYSLRQLLVRVAEEYLWWIIRSWPGYEGVWLRYVFLKCTTKSLAGFCWISQGCTVSNSHSLSIGRGFCAARNVLIDAIGGIEIGDDANIGPNCVLLAHEHSMLTKGSFTGPQAYTRKPIKIGTGAWIGSNCFVKAGVTIGDHAVVGACSNVMTDVPTNGRVIGSPARPLVQALRELLAPPVSTSERPQSTEAEAGSRGGNPGKSDAGPLVADG